MEQKKMKRNFKIFDGIPVPTIFPEEGLKSALSYRPKKGDIFIATYPKCGTTWMHHIVLLILRHGKVFDDPLDFVLGCPFLEIMGAEGVDCMIRPGAIKTHLPYNKIPKSEDAKYIYLCRNPKDCLVSFYCHVRDMSGSGFRELSFVEFFEYFVSGEIPFGDCIDHIISWYQHRNDKNVYFVTYERLKKDIRGEILNLARFIGEEYENTLLNDPKILDDVVQYSSFDYMKKTTNDTMLKIIKGEAPFCIEDTNFPPFMVRFLKSFQIRDESKPDGGIALQIVRKGIVGDWKNHLNPDQIRRFEARIAEKTANSDVMNLWN